MKPKNPILRQILRLRSYAQPNSSTINSAKDKREITFKNNSQPFSPNFIQIRKMRR